MLARRDHSEQELCRKLIARGFDVDDVTEIIAELKHEGLQSDHRFADSYTRLRISKGSGSVRIGQELRQRGVTDALIKQAMQEYEQEWSLKLEEVRGKKFGEEISASFKEQARQSRFLQYRGFPSEQIGELFRTVDE